MKKLFSIAFIVGIVASPFRGLVLPELNPASPDPLTRSSQLQGQPEAISFIRDGDVWLIRPDGTNERRMTHGGGYAEVALSPDGSTIAFIHTIQSGDPPEPAPEIGLLNVKTLEKRTLVPPEGNCWPCGEGLYTFFYYSYRSIVWRPDGAALLLMVEDATSSGLGVRTVDIGTGLWDIPLDYTKTGTANYFDVSPFSGRVVYTIWTKVDWEIRLAAGIDALQRGKDKLLAQGDQSIFDDRWEEYGDICWLGSSQRAAFLKSSFPEKTESIDWIDTDTGERGSLLSGLVGVTDLACSPKGDSVIYAADEVLWVYNLSSGESRRLAAGHAPDWGVAIPISQEECGSWKRVGIDDPGDLRIIAEPMEVSFTGDCESVFRLHNDTEALGTGGYTFQLQTNLDNATVRWEPAISYAAREGFLLPPLRLEVHLTPIDPSRDATVAIRGQESLRGITLDATLFVLRSAMTLGDPGAGCAIPEEKLVATAFEVSPALDRTIGSVIRGDVPGAKIEFENDEKELLRLAAGSYSDAQVECAADILKLVLGRAVTLVQIARYYLSWIQVSLMDYIFYQGQPVDVTFEYSPS